VLDEFVDQMLVAGANVLESPGAAIVGTAATAIQLGGKNPLAAVAPAEHRQLDEWIARARKDIWAGVVPPPPPELPDDDLAQAKASFVIDVLTQVLTILYDPPSAVFVALSMPDVVAAYRAWEEAERAEQRSFLPVLIEAICEPATLGFNLAYRHAQADVNTTFAVALHLADWLPSPT
jgi:hypothetical protein